MKILLDECLPVDFRHSFPGHEAHSVEWAGFKGKKNGELLLAAEGAGYQVLLTVDQGISRQQTMVGRKLSIILIRSRTNQMEDLLPLAPVIIRPLRQPIAAPSVSSPTRK
jgi:predicted nuclease of predicted toxin-antitoxin system